MTFCKVLLAACCLAYCAAVDVPVTVTPPVATAIQISVTDSENTECIVSPNTRVNDFQTWYNLPTLPTGLPSGITNPTTCTGILVNDASRWSHVRSVYTGSPTTLTRATCVASGGNTDTCTAINAVADACTCNKVFCVTDVQNMQNNKVACNGVSQKICLGVVGATAVAGRIRAACEAAITALPTATGTIPSGWTRLTGTAFDTALEPINCADDLASACKMSTFGATSTSTSTTPAPGESTTEASTTASGSYGCAAVTAALAVGVMSLM